MATKRGNGQGSVFKYKNGYRAQLTHYENGVRYTKTKSGFRTKRSALEWCVLNASFARNMTSPTFSSLYKEWASTHYQNVSDKKIQQYTHVYDESVSLYKMRFADIGVRHFQAVLDAQKNTYAVRKIFKSVYSMMSDYAMRCGYITTNYARLCVVPSAEKPNKRAFTSDEISKVWTLWNDKNDLAAGATLIMIYTGMRWGEISTIKPENIYLDDGYMLGGIKTETSKLGEILIVDAIKPIVRTLMLPNNLVAVMSTEGFRSSFNAMQKRLGIPRHTVHECRHTTATILASLGVQPAIISEIMRHSSYAQTMAYTHVQRSEKLSNLNGISTVCNAISNESCNEDCNEPI